MDLKTHSPISREKWHQKIQKSKISPICDLSWKIEFLGYESGQGVKKLDLFSIFRIFKFWSILTTFDPVLSMKRTTRIRDFLRF